MPIEQQELAYLRLLSAQYPSVEAASKAIIQSSAELNLPKNTEHFVSDIHGAYEPFCHILKSGSGAIKFVIDSIFGNTLSAGAKWDLATLIYYPEKKIPLALQAIKDENRWFSDSLRQLIRVSRVFSSRYTRPKVRQFNASPYADIIEELLYQHESSDDKTDGQRGLADSILDSIVFTGSARAFITALAHLIQKLAVAQLHIIGDIYDRGPGAHRIMDLLTDYHNVDIQWGNHDIVWMGAAAGSEACMANVIRIALRYASLETLETGYAISLLPLASFAIEAYRDDPCERFVPKVLENQAYSEQELRHMAQMHKAITVIQLKLEGRIIARRPQYRMENRLLLDKMDLAAGTVTLEDAEYPLLDTHFPTLDPAHPYALTDQESSVVEKLKQSFINSEKLQRHTRFLFTNGSMYRVHNENLLYHGCIAMNEDESFMTFKVAGDEFSGKAFLDRVDTLARQGYFSNDDPERKQYGMDAMWYLWSGAQSPLFGKEKMATFERYLIADKASHTEKRNPYYDLRQSETAIGRILEEFGVNPERGRIINGHVPVRVRKGESPVKADGKLLVIDGGFSSAYQSHTGIAGYTLASNADGLFLVAHQPFDSIEASLTTQPNLEDSVQCLEAHSQPVQVSETDEGREIKNQVKQLQRLVEAYQSGLIKES